MKAETKSIEMGRGLLANPVLVAGDGTPVVFLHGLMGQEWDELQDGLSAKHRVYSPSHVGIQESDELRHFDGMYDLVLYYDELFDKLGVPQFDLVGHSFGGMVAAEFAAAFPARVGKLVLIDPLGLWRDDAPVEDYLLVSPERRAALLFGDPSDAKVKERIALPADEEDRIRVTLDRVSTLAAVSHFLWPIPERGLSKRLHRVRADTLVVWGEQDKLVPSIYAKDFASKIANAHVDTIAGAGHTPQFSQPEKVLSKVSAFLDR
jgi:pimeloyl-ACP methyl ester carboxylesterase